MSESNGFTTTKRRQSPRTPLGPALIAPPFPVTARGRGEDGSRFTEDVTLEDLRAHSLLLRIRRATRPGAVLFIVIGIGSDHPNGAVAPAIAIRGKVVQVTPLPLGGYTVAISFERFRFLFLPS